VLTASAASAQTSVTLFNSGRVLVRRTVPMNVSAGTSTATIPIGAFTPSTFATLDAGVRLIGVSTSDMVSEEGLLRRNVGRTFAIDTGASGSRQARLAGLDPERWEWLDRPGIHFGRPGRISWPKELVPAQVTADVTVTSDRARQALRVMYETEGSAWSASYQLFLGSAGHFDGVATVRNGTLDLSDAEVQLMSGDIGNATPADALNFKAGFAASAPMARVASAAYPDGAASQQALGESHLYTLPGRSTFVPGATFTVSLFDPAPARADRRYVMSGALPFYGGFSQAPDEQSVPVSVAYHLDRKLGTTLGDLPLPAGYVGVFDIDRSGRAQLVGQGSIGHTAPGDELFVGAGTAFDVTARRVQTEYSVARLGTTAPIRTAATSGYRVTLHNAKDSAVVVDVREDRGGEWSILDSSLPAVRKSSTRTVFNVPVPARDSAVLTYRVRAVW
jgi:hypothetical protein